MAQRTRCDTPLRRGPAVFAICVGITALGACRLFVDLDELGGGPAAEDAAPDGVVDGGSDTTPPSDASTNDAADASDAAPCPKGRGPDMVLVKSGSTSFCIDSTEVSQAQYVTFLDDKAGDVSGQGAECQWNTTYAPSQSCTSIPSFNPTTRTNKAVSGVDWCDAVAFCRWAGKRLCGRVQDGGRLPDLDDGGEPSLTNPQESEWFAACSNGGVRSFPYGFTFDGTACNGKGHDAGDLIDVGSLATCEGGVPGLFDMSGNLLEWENACDSNAATPALDQACSYRGGTYYSEESDLRCDRTSKVRRAHVDGDCDLGIRCCATPK